MYVRELNKSRVMIIYHMINETTGDINASEVGDHSPTIPYVHDFVCTYQLLDADDSDDADLAEDLYRTQFLQAFGVDIYHDEKIASTTRLVYETYAESTVLGEVIRRNQKNCFLGGNDPYESFVMLFAYPTFHILHACIGSLIRGTVDEDAAVWQELHEAI